MSKLTRILESATTEYPPNYTQNTSVETSCSTCLHYSSKRCMKYGIGTSAEMVCSTWTDRSNRLIVS